MDLFSVGEFKAQFSDCLKTVLAGEPVGITYGKKKKPIAILTPYKILKTKKRKLGIWEGKGSFKMAKDFKITVEEFLSS